MSAAMLHGGTIIARKLREENIDALFTLTGGHISPIYDGCFREGGIRLVDFRHEQAAAHAADAYARLLRRPSVAAVTAGPGVTGAITGIANAFYAGSPVVMLGGRNPLNLEGMGSLQDAPHAEMLRPVTKRVDVAYDAWRLGEVLHYAFSSAIAPRQGPVYVDLPLDVQLTEVEEGGFLIPPKCVYRTASAPDGDAVSQIALRLSRARRPVVFAGSGAYWSACEAELKELVESAGLPLYVNGQARGILPSAHPNLLSQSRRMAMSQCDFILILGADFDFRLSYGRKINENAFTVHVDPQPNVIGINRPVDLGIASDIRAFLRELLRHQSRFARMRRRQWVHDLSLNEQARRRESTANCQSNAVPIHPSRFVAEVARWIDPDAVIVADGGDIVSMAASAISANLPGHWLDPGPFGCLGVGVPFSIAARLAKPEQQVVAIFGDGAFGFNCMEFDSAVRQHLPFVGVMGNDGAWGEMRTFHEKLFGPEHMEGQYLSQGTRYEVLVDGLGGYGERVTEPTEIRPALDRAANSGVPSLVNVILDQTFRRWGATMGEDLGLPWRQSSDTESESQRK